MAQITNCLKLISRINEGDQDSLISRIDELQALGVPAQRAQVQAAIDVLARLQREATGIQRSAKRDVTDTPEFKSWFGDSKVVDAQGRPLVVYHGTQGSGIVLQDKRAVFFTSSPAVASSYANGGDGLVQPAYLRLSNPLEVDAMGATSMSLPFGGMRVGMPYLVKEAKRLKRDGVIVRNVEDMVSGMVGDYFIAIGKSQIKSAIGNNGQFDPANPDITRSAARKATDTPEFKRWFGDSKVVDADGKPLVVYHGTRRDVSAFDRSKIGSATDEGFLGDGFYFTDSKRAASAFAKGDGGNVIPAYLSIKNPYYADGLLPDYMDAQYLLDAGFDGVIYETDGSGDYSEYVALKPEQIKSAIGNNGQFDPANPDITRSAKRSQYAWAEREDTPAGPVLRGDGFYLLPQREIAQDDFGDGGFGENGLLGHAERVVPGTRTFAFRIVGDDGKLAGVLVSDVDETGALRSIHDIEIDAKRSGLGSKIVATIAANTSEPIKIQDITNEADPFWTRIGVGYKDPYGDASLDWQDVAQYVGSRAAAPVDQDWTFAQDGSRGLSPDSYEVRELSPEELEGIQFSTKRNDLGFYSALERGIEGMQTKQAPAGAWKTQIKGLVNKGIVKQDEVTWSGIEDWLDLQDGKVTKEAIADYLKRGGVKVEEVTLSDMTNADAGFYAEESPDDDGVWIVYNADDEIVETFDSEADADSFMRDRNSEAAGGTKYGKYTLPGGSQYREVLLTLPEKEVASKAPTGQELKEAGWTARVEYNQWTGQSEYSIYNPSGEWAGQRGGAPGQWTEERALQHHAESMARNEARTKSEQINYRSSHWDQKNVLAHIRVNDRVDADGRKVLFVEELQSDWGQDGKKKGFNNASLPPGHEVRKISVRNPLAGLGGNTVQAVDRYAVFDSIGNKLTTDFQTEGGALSAFLADSRKVPPAPFVTKTEGWLNLALKRVIAMAVDGGYDAVAFVNGDQSADRYDLSKQVESVSAYKVEGGYKISAKTKDGDTLPAHNAKDESEIADLLGKELAAKIVRDLNADGMGDRAMNVYSGLDLKVGGDGMRAFYDRIVPNAVKALLKKLGGGRMEMVSIGESNDGKFVILKPDGTFHSGISGVALFPSRASAQAAANKLNRSQGSGHKPAPAPMQGGEQPGFDITPAMREKVSAEGLPLFSRKRGWQGFPDSVVDTNLGAQSKDPSYEAAKAGDMKAALDLVSRVMSSDAEDKVRRMIGDSKPIVVSVHAEEAAGRNKIPLATAIELGDRLGLEVDTKIVQATRAKRTGADGMARIGVQPEFTGDVVRGADYLIVDDTLTQGGTIAQLKTHIEEGGGRVVGVFALSGKQYSAKISLDEQTLSQLRERYGSIEPWWRSELGYGFDGLTQSEARFILKSGLSPDQVRDRVTAARQAAGIGAGAQDQARLSAKRDVTDTPEFKRWFGDSKVVDADGKPLVVYHGGRAGLSEFKDPDGRYRTGIFFTSSKDMADAYGRGGETYAVYLSLQKPFVLDAKSAYYSEIPRPSQMDEFAVTETVDSDLIAEWAFKNGYDGVVLKNLIEGRGGEGDVYIASKGAQIKSAIGNNGQFDPANPDITRSAKRDVTETPEFKRWFGDSKVVDADGKPLVVYHGTSANVTTFSDKMRRGGGVSKLGKAGIYFTTDAALAALYGEATYPVYLKAENPLSLPSTDFPSISSGLIFPDEAAEIQAAGYDAVTSGSVIVVFNPEQIKSATGNSGQFDPASADITKSLPRIPGLNAGPVERTTGDYGREYTPQQLRMFKNVGRTTSKPALIDRLKEARKDLGKKMAQGIVDQFRPIRELGGNAYTLARLSKGSAGAFEALLGHGKLKIVDGAYDADTTGGFLDLVGKPLGKELEDFMFWVASNRAETLSLQDRENLFTQEDIDAGKSLADGDLEFDYLLANGATTRDRRAAYEDALKKFNEFNKNVLDIAEQSGLIDGESRQFWEGEFYVPFYRVSEEDGEFVGAKIKGGLARQRAFHELKGGSQKLNSDLLANTMRNWAHLIDASAKNRAAKATLEAAQAVGIALESDAETVRQLGKSMGGKGGTVWFMDGGQQRHFLIGDPYLLEAINSLEYAGLRGPLMDALSTMKHWLTVGVTASPAFKVRNLIRDSIQAISLSGLSYNPVKNLVEGYKATDRESQDYVSVLASGGLIRFGTMLEGNAAERVRRLVQKGVPASTILNTPGKVKDFYGKFVEPAVEAYQELGNRGEEINRASLYKQLRAQGVNHAEASLMARDLMDFSMQGTWTSIRFLTQVVPFLNARLQGLYKLGRGAAEDPKRFAMVAGATALVSIALLGAYGDDDDWKKREDWDRDGFWWFKFGGTAFRIPKPFEVGVIATLAERGVELFTNDEFTAKRFGSRVMHLLGDNLAMNPIPQAVKPMLDIYANKDSFSGRPIESMGMERIQSEYRYNVNTSMIARGASSALNAVTRTVGADSLSPVQIDSLIRGYFGWLGTFVVAGADMAIRPLTSEPARPQADYLRVVTQGFLRTLPEPGSKYVSAMYDQAKILEQAYATHRQMLKEGKLDEAREFAAENKDLLDRYRLIEAVKKTQSNINRRIREIEISGMDPARKREEIQKLRDQADRSARAVY